MQTFNDTVQSCHLQKQTFQRYNGLHIFRGCTSLIYVNAGVPVGTVQQWLLQRKGNVVLT